MTTTALARTTALVLLVLLAACGGSSDNTLTVFAAASLTDAFTELAAAYEVANPGATVLLNFAGSQALRTQIEQGAQADVFASANDRHMQSLVDAGLIDAQAVADFATNRLVVIVPASNPAAVVTLDDLARPGIKLVLAAADVPVGNYTRQMLANAGDEFAQAVLANVVSEETNVRVVLNRVVLGEADAGIVYATDARAGGADVLTIDIPDPLNVPASYPLAPLSASRQPDNAARFVDFVLSAEGQAILASYGFGPPSE